MIDYEEELKKFEPCLDVADAECAIYERELTDILDILQEVLREAKSGRRVKEGDTHELYELWRISGGQRSGLLPEMWM